MSHRNEEVLKSKEHAEMLVKRKLEIMKHCLYNRSRILRQKHDRFRQYAK